MVAVNAHLLFSGQNLLEGIAQHVSQELEGRKSANSIPLTVLFPNYVNHINVVQTPPCNV